MKVHVDTDKKTIEIQDKIPLSNIISLAKEFFGDKWKEISIEFYEHSSPLMNNDPWDLPIKKNPYNDPIQLQTTLGKGLSGNATTSSTPPHDGSHWATKRDIDISQFK